MLYIIVIYNNKKNKQNILRLNSFFQYRTSAFTEISKLLTGKCELTFAAILKLIDEDLFPAEDPKWAMNVTTNMKNYLMVRFYLI